MIRLRHGWIIEILENRANITLARVQVEGSESLAIHYPGINGQIHEGQRVLLNTTAKHLGLGTGGYHFILHAEGNDYFDPQHRGHIMKMRYTPFQIKTLCVEEEYPDLLTAFDNLDNMPVIVLPLHSMIAPIVTVIKALHPAAKIAYLMSDGGALPLAFSKTVQQLKEKNWLQGTITFGHAFGGDYEAVNVFSSLLAAKWVIEADIAIIAMGPGIVGTGTPYGFSGVEQAEFLHAVNILQGDPIAVVRVSFADKRQRHRGISHHSQTVLGKLTLVRTKIPLPLLSGEKKELIQKQLQDSGIEKKHQLFFYEPSKVERILSQSEMNLKTMGRFFCEDYEFFITAGVAGLLALDEMEI